MKTNLFIKQLLGTIVFYAAIFISAGSIFYIPGLIYAGLGIVMIILNYTILQIDHELIQERSKPGEGAKKWDKTLLGLSFLATIAMFIIAGLDSGRFCWSPKFSIWLMVAGFILTATGQLLFLIAQKQNRFFSSTVRIQTERHHTVCDTGLYKIVRHPAYMGSFIQTLGFPLLFGSVWSIVPVLFSIILLVTRTQLEDSTLQKELAGYTEYTQKVKYRLIPCLW
jgi:protein-S-isoprenylcysteine O-methyltransferase Ste14